MDCVTNSVQMRAGRSPPVTFLVGLLSSLPTQTPTTISGVNPMNQASLLCWRGAGLSGGWDADPRGFAGAFTNDAGEQIAHGGARGWIGCRLQRRLRPREQDVIAVADGTDGIRLDAFRVGRDRRKGAGHLQQGDLA